MHRHQCQDFVCPGHDVHFDTDPIETSDSNSDSNSANDDDTSMDTSDHMTASNHPHTPTDLPSANLQGFNPLHSMQTDLKEESSWQESWQHLDIEMQAAETRDPHDSDAPQHLPNITNNISNLHNNTQDLHRQTDLHAPHRHSPERTSTRRSLRRPSPLRRPSSLPLLQTAGPESPSHRLRGFNGRRAAERDDTPLDYAPVEVERSPSSRVPHFNVQEAFMEVSSAEMSSSQQESSPESATTQQQQQLPHQGFPASNNDNDMQQPETQPNQGPTRSFMQHSQQQQHPSSSSASSMPHGMRFHPTEPPPYIHIPYTSNGTSSAIPVDILQHFQQLCHETVYTPSMRADLRTHVPLGRIDLPLVFTTLLSNFYCETFLWMRMNILIHRRSHLTRNRLRFMAFLSGQSLEEVVVNTLYGYFSGYHRGRCALLQEICSVLQEVSSGQTHQGQQQTHQGAARQEQALWLRELSVELGIHLNPRQMLRSYTAVVRDILMRRLPYVPWQSSQMGSPSAPSPRSRQQPSQNAQQHSQHSQQQQSQQTRFNQFRPQAATPR